MANMNTGKIIAGGLAAGLVINVVESVMNLFLIADGAEALLADLERRSVVSLRSASCWEFSSSGRMRQSGHDTVQARRRR